MSSTLARSTDPPPLSVLPSSSLPVSSRFAEPWVGSKVTSIVNGRLIDCECLLVDFTESV